MTPPPTATRIALLVPAAVLLAGHVPDRVVPGSAADGTPFRPGPLTLQHTTLVVSDFAASEQFYKGVLGLEEIDAPFLPERQMFLAVGEGLELHVGEVPDVEIRPSAFNHFAISAQDFDGFLEHLREHGIVYSNLGGGIDHQVQTRGDGVRQTFFQDPDGYWIEVNDLEPADRRP
jgi:lactoylglutathione lyase